MNLKTNTVADPKLSRIVHGPSNVSSLKDIEPTEENKQKFVNDWATFSQALLWIAQNSTDPNSCKVAFEAIQLSELLDIRKND